jgi:mono/diheme cytochrome c family protein
MNVLAPEAPPFSRALPWLPRQSARAAVAIAFAWAAVAAAAEPAAGDQAAIYSEKIRPLLAERCFSCHGSLAQEAGLRLDTAALMIQGGDSGPAVAKGDPDASLIVDRTDDPDPASRMPPEGEGEPLSPEQLEILRAWIAAGCPVPPDEKPEADPREHWAFRSRVRPPVPPVVNTGWVKNPIDAFVATRHEQAGVVPQPEPPRHVLVRRLFLDLIGLPPQPEELAEIEADPSLDWYEALVERLLSDPRHGERWARHWMDVWRYSDWWGLEEKHRYSAKNMWHFRDWIVESLNADVGYDEMVRQMLAADELYPEDLDKLRATGFLARNWYVYNRDHWLEDTVEHVGKGLLGLTMNCAKCHSHKYDPIPQADYYRMRAFFEPHLVRQDLVPGEADLSKDGVPRVYDGRLEDPTYLFVRGNAASPDKSRTIEPGVPAVLEFEEFSIEPVRLPKAAFQPERRGWVIDTHLAAARQNLAARQEAAGRKPSPFTAQAVAVATARVHDVECRAAAMRAKWSADDADGSDTPAAVRDGLRAAAVKTNEAAVRAERQLAIARAWYGVAEVNEKLQAALEEKKDAAALAAIGRNLEAAREAVEKAQKAVATPIGQHTPLPGAAWAATNYVKANEDDPFTGFPETSSGRRSALSRWITDPRNPLAARVAVNHLWSRHFGKPIVATVFDFGRKGAAASHPELLDWLASELVENRWSMKHLHRLIVSSATYRMGSSLAGAGRSLAVDPDNRLLWRREPLRLEAQVVRDSVLALAGSLDPAMGGPPVPKEEQEASRRRSLYFWHSGISRSMFLATFDDALVTECYRREQSIVPQQALALVNAGIVRDSAATIASRIASRASGDAAFVEAAFATVVGRKPTADEVTACLAAVDEWRALPESKTEDPVERPLVNLVWSLFSHNDFVTVR